MSFILLHLVPLSLLMGFVVVILFMVFHNATNKKKAEEAE